ncbi:unnamed protein product, partial [Mesorhabditis belari]|uniref:Protein kinase domain-containing protein n=1 Tax=Mesorhabditis belari TaxID=2138241 RepID=A0AAF3EJ07_9BILA
MEIPVDLSGVNLEWIGHGASGSIFLIDSFEPAISLKHIITRADTRRNEFLIEVETLKRLNHPNIVKYLGIGKFKQKRTNIWAEGILMEYCGRGALCHLIDNPAIIYTIYNVVSWTRQLIKALGYLAENRAVHRDIKPANVFVSTYFELKLGDFGSIKEITRSCSSFTPAVGTRRYMSPEQSKSISGKRLSHRSDVYSMGLVIWEMIERRKVFARFGSHYDYGLFATEDRQLIDVEVLECEPEIRFTVEK